MKRLPLALCLLVLGFFAVCAHASIDPAVGIGDPTCIGSEISIGPGGNFTFSSNTNGGGFFTFCNNTGSVFNSVDIKFVDTAGFVPENITCASPGNVFSTNCNVSVTNGIMDIFFSVPTETESTFIEVDPCAGQGIRNGCQMTVNLNDPLVESSTQCVPSEPNNFCDGNSGSWGPTPIAFFAQGSADTADAVIPTVPEPASMLLVGTGLVAVWRLRRRRI